jgi:sugar phosphate isomerase/epimerase
MPQFLPLSIQLYSLRNIEGLANQLDVVKTAGYRHVELFGPQLDGADHVSDLLNARGLCASSSHVSLQALRDRFDSIMAACKRLGFTQLFMPAVPLDERNNDGAYWRMIGSELGAFAVRAQDHGISLGYHNHHWELQKKEEGRTALESLFDGAGSSPLTWQVDVAWLVRGGADPAQWIDRYQSRVVSVHAKDLAPPGEKLDEDGWADVGSGVLDWKTLANVSKTAGAQWLVAEHDKPNNPTRFANASYAFLNSL